MDSTHKEIIHKTGAINPEGDELGAIRRIRTETVLSRLPIHNLAKKGRVNIQIVKKDADGHVTLQWEVSHSDRYGQPRAVAYKLDTIVINRRLDEEGRPLPKMVCLGSLREIADELGCGDTNLVRRAMRQNAFAAITARLTYTTAAGHERRIEANFTRYSVIFTGEKLPDGRRADAVYIILNEPYREVLDSAPVRPLNYDYLKVLSPAAQRFYEILSYRIFAALNNKADSEARISYSDYCMFSPQQRYFDYDHFKKQMWKIHRSHLQSGYLKASRYTAATDAGGNPDWMMHYVPGPRAHAEFRAFSARKGKDLSGLRQDGGLEIGEWRPGSHQRVKMSAGTEPPDGNAIELVRYFHRRARRVEAYELPPGGKEGAQAEDLLRTYGEEAARFVIDYGIRQAERTKFSMRTFGALMQYVPDAIAAFEERRAASVASDARERAEAKRKQETEEWYERGRKALAALPPEKRAALEAEAKADFLARWPRQANQTESQFFKRMIDNALIAKIINREGRSNSSDGPIRVS
jgi:hypothetical protein